MLHRFFDFTLDHARSELRRDGVPVAIQPLLFELLTYLVERRGTLVTPEQLLADVWRGVFTPGVVTTAIAALRQVLEDDARAPRFIETVRGRGYRFVALEPSDPRLVGREAELAVFERCFAGSGSFALFVHGLAGIGKSTLLRAFAAIAAREGATPRIVFAPLLGATPGEVMTGLRAELAESRPTVLLIDDYDAWAPLDEWFRWVCLPQLEVRGVVLAGRRPPVVGWDAPVDRTTTLALGGLSDDEGARLLGDVPDARALSARWSGHPLALRLLAGIDDPSMAEPGELSALTERFRLEPPTDMHRRALEAASLVPGIELSLLRELIESPELTQTGLARTDVADAHFDVTRTDVAPDAQTEGARTDVAPDAQTRDAFETAASRDLAPLMEWLAARPFITIERGRVHVHRVPAAAIVARLGREEPARLAALTERALLAITSRLDDLSEPTQRLAASAQLFATGEHHPLLRPLYHPAADELSLHLGHDETARTELIALVRDQEGVAAARVMARWLEDEHELWCVRETDGRFVAAALTVFVTRARLTERFDPLLESMERHLVARALTEGTAMVHHVLYPARDAPRPAPAMHRCMEVLHLHHQSLPREDITDSYVVFPSAAPWLDVARQSGFQHAFDVQLGGPPRPVVHRSMRDGTGAWIRTLARNLAAARAA